MNREWSTEGTVSMFRLRLWCYIFPVSCPLRNDFAVTVKGLMDERGFICDDALWDRIVPRMLVDFVTATVVLYCVGVEVEGLGCTTVDTFRYGDLFIFSLLILCPVARLKQEIFQRLQRFPNHYYCLQLHVHLKHDVKHFQLL